MKIAYDVVARWPGADVRFLAATIEPVRTDRGLTVLPTDTPATLANPDMIVVPGSETPLPLLEDRPLIDWIRGAAPGCQWTVSVCAGAGLYAAAGLLEGKCTTTHRGFRDSLRALGIDVVEDRVALRLALKILRGDRPFRTAAALNAHALRAPLRRARHAGPPRVQGPIYGCLPDALTGDRQEA